MHYVTNELDGGPAILQARVTIEDLDTAETLASKVLEVEHCIFPEAVNWHLQERVVHAEQGAYLDGKLCHQMVPPGNLPVRSRSMLAGSSAKPNVLDCGNFISRFDNSLTASAQSSDAQLVLCGLSRLSIKQRRLV